MTKAQFQEWPGLLMAHQVVTVGYGRATLEKFVDCGVLRRIRPPGCDQNRYQKKQIALLLDWPDLVAVEEARFAKEPMLLRPCVVRDWTGWSEVSLLRIAEAGGLKSQRFAHGERRFLKREIAELLGFGI
jgi:hypothetical protein